jgi:SAM-dependent methyltransferase
MTEKDWTQEVFVDHGELFLKMHERTLERTKGEAEHVAALLTKHGVPEGGRILDAPCGIGRHSVHLARMGYDVTGVDLSEAYIDRAKQLAKAETMEGRLDLRLGDIRKVGTLIADAKGSFHAVMNMWTSLGYWDEETDLSILRQFHDLAAREAILLIDIMNRDHIVKHFSPFGLTAFDGTEQHELRHFDLERSVLELTWDFYERVGNDLKFKATTKVRFRVYSLHELRRLVEAAGWTFLEAWGSLERDVVSADRKKLVVVAKKA